MTTIPDTPCRTAPVSDVQLVALVKDARAGDELAWAQIIRRLDPRLRRSLRTYRLSPADVDDVLQATWTLLYRNIDRIRDPAAVTGWLVTTVRRQALQLLQAHKREWLTDDPDLGLVEHATPESEVLDAECHDAFLRALGTLPTRQRRLVTLLLAQPALDYAQLGSLLAMPVGSIGPTRARGLARLERNAELRSLVLTA
jgi:RNA polymerase sigma factor (sigma-70 family)